MKALFGGLPPWWLFVAMIAIDVVISIWSGHYLIGLTVMFAAWLLVVFSIRHTLRRMKLRVRYVCPNCFEHVSLDDVPIKVNA
jgi:uncharacterized membrane protein